MSISCSFNLLLGEFAGLPLGEFAGELFRSESDDEEDELELLPLPEEVLLEDDESLLDDAEDKSWPFRSSSSCWDFLAIEGNEPTLSIQD